MDRDIENSNIFVANRMCPPNRIVTFFFTDPCKNVLYHSREYDVKPFEIPQGINLKFIEEKKEDSEIILKFKVQYLDSTIMEYETP